MAVRIKLLAFITALTSALCFGGNVMPWIQENFSHRESELRFGLSHEDRFGTSKSHDFRWDEIHNAVSVDYQVLDWMSVGINDRFVLLRNGSDARYREDHRPGIDVAFFAKNLYGWDFLNRSRFIYRQVEHEHGYFRYRNLSKAMMPWKFTEYNIRPFLSYEWYWDDGCKERVYKNRDKFSQQWFTIGTDFKISENISMSLWYMLVQLKDTSDHSWMPSNVIGFTVGISF